MADNGLKLPRASTEFERKVLCQYIRRQKPRKTYLEIGSSSGGSLSFFAPLFEKRSQLIAVDLAMSTMAGKTNRLSLEALIRRFVRNGYAACLVSGDSTDPETVAAVRTALGSRQADVLLIDGGHAGYIVYQDVRNYVPFVRPGGLVIMHDIGLCPLLGVRKPEKILFGRNCFEAWRSLASQHTRKLIVQEGAGYGLVWLND